MRFNTVTSTRLILSLGFGASLLVATLASISLAACDGQFAHGCLSPAGVPCSDWSCADIVVWRENSYRTDDGADGNCTDNTGGVSFESFAAATTWEYCGSNIPMFFGACNDIDQYCAAYNLYNDAACNTANSCNTGIIVACKGDPNAQNCGG